MTNIFIVLIDSGDYDERQIIKTFFNDITVATLYYESNVSDAKSQNQSFNISTVRLFKTHWTDHQLIAGDIISEYNPYTLSYPDLGLNIDWLASYFTPMVIKPHLCPFKQEIHNDHRSLCICDDEQRYQCTQDI
jgi:hypothetical protein